MGFESRRGNAKFVNIKKGQFSLKIEGEYKLIDDDLVATLTDIAVVDDEYQGQKFKKLCLTLDDGTESFILQMKMESGYANGFCMAIQNADLSQPIRFSPSFKVENDKNKATLFLSQHGKALKWFYRKDSPGDLPQLKKVEFKGQTHWDNMEQQEFLINLLLTVIKPKLVHPVLAGAPNPLTTSAAKAPADVTEPIDDLPF